MKAVGLTGFPGWLTTGMLKDFRRNPELGLDRVVAFVHPNALDAANVQAAEYPWEFDLVPFDLNTESDLTKSLATIEALVHTAGLIHVRRTRDWYDVNTRGTIALAEQAKKAGVRRFVFVSSIAACGKSHPSADLVETDEPRPMHHYGRSKLLAERALMQLHDPGIFDVVILRPPMFYGPPVPKRHVDIYKRILHGHMPLVGGGRYRRSVVHIDNLSQAVRLAMTSPNAPGQTYFIADRAVQTTRGVVEAMAEALGTKPRYVQVPAAFAELAYQIDRGLSRFGIYIAPIHLLGEAHWHQSASSEKAERELGYRPAIEMRGGMAHAVAWCRSNNLL